VRFVFLHGGPGFNSFAEQAMLGPLCVAAGHEMAFWQEPSRLRPDGDPFHADDAFERWLASAERFVLRAASRPVHLVAHSWSVHAALEIARRHPDRLATVTLVAPTMDSFVGFRRILHVAHGDFAKTQPEAAAAIAGALARTRVFFDDPMREGLLNALRDEDLFSHYFAHADQLRALFAAWARPEAQFDRESFLAVLADFARRGGALLSTSRVTVPAFALFGAADCVAPMSEHADPLRAVLPHGRFECLADAGHCLHLDPPERFVEILVDRAGSGAAVLR
jgi:pimeloyl-ACP methyl ester carboxylesterase